MCSPSTLASAEALQDPRRERLVLRADVVDDVPLRVEVERRAARDRPPSSRALPPTTAEVTASPGAFGRVLRTIASRSADAASPRTRNAPTSTVPVGSCAFAKVRSAGVLPAPREDALQHLAEGVAPGEHHGSARRCPSRGGGRRPRREAAPRAPAPRGSPAPAWSSTLRSSSAACSRSSPPHAGERERPHASAPAAATRRARLPGPACLAFDLVDVSSTSSKSGTKSACTSSFGVSNEMSADPSAASLSYCGCVERRS